MISGLSTCSLDQGVQDCNRDLLQECTPYTQTLADLTINSLYSFFERNGHHPSEDMIYALTSVARKMEDMANGIADPYVYLSSLDPGIGKTQTIVHFIRYLLASQDHGDVAVLLCVSRLEEIRGLVSCMALEREQFAVLTSDQELNGLGVDPQQGRILFTTHRMVEVQCEGRGFPEVQGLSWRGRPRQVRIWDEALLPGQALTVSRDEIALLFKALRSTHPHLTATLEALFSDLRKLPEGHRFLLPDFATDHDVDLNEVLRLMDARKNQEINPAQTLWFLSGKTVTVRRDGAFGETMLDYRNSLPDGLSPILVLDASGRVRTLYRHWEERRGGLVRLPSAPKRYDNLTVHVWQTGGGKGAFKRRGDQLLDGIASTINAKPEEEWLVVHHKAGIAMDFETELTSRLTSDPSRVHFRNWGSHDATNQFSHVPNVILAGTLFYRLSYYEAMGRLAADHPSEVGPLEQSDFNEIMLGEHRHLLLQAGCRGSVRRCQGDVCAPCHLYIVASVSSRISSAIPDIFPGCRRLTWQPVKRALGGKVAQAFECVVSWLEENPDDLLPFKIVYELVGMDRSNFKRRVRRHEGFVAALEEVGIMEGPDRSRYPTGFTRHSFLFADEDAA